MNVSAVQLLTTIIALIAYPGSPKVHKMIMKERTASGGAFSIDSAANRRYRSQGLGLQILRSINTGAL